VLRSNHGPECSQFLGAGLALHCAKAPLAQMAGLWQFGSKSLTYSTAKLGQKPVGEGILGGLSGIFWEQREINR
jgi:hypothetical protein